jgi:hypothetical protein
MATVHDILAEFREAARNKGAMSDKFERVVINPVRSALPPKADIRLTFRHVSQVPLTTISVAANGTAIRSPRRRGRGSGASTTMISLDDDKRNGRAAKSLRPTVVRLPITVRPKAALPT